jgi:sugar/nucleoside kinase (ribokinase family)
MNNVFENYLKYCKGLTIFTFGSDELWYARQGRKMHVFKPFKIEPVDTTGAGDSFRSGIIYGLLQKCDDRKTIEFASAVAANVCLTRPHTLNAPGLAAIQSFITQHK